MSRNLLIERVVSEVLNEVLLSSTCTYLFCRDSNGKWNTLIGKRSSTAPAGANQYTPPMGLLEKGENPLDGAVREIYEETELKINRNLLKEYNKEQWGRGKVGINYYCILGGCIDDYVTGTGDGENDRFIWIPIARYREYPFAFGTDNTMLQIAKRVLR